MVLFSAAWTCGKATPARAEALATRVVADRNSWRDFGWDGFSFMEYLLGPFHLPASIPQSR